MTSANDNLRRFGTGARRMTAMTAALALVLDSAAPAFSQGRRRAEPEANPQFQQQMQAPAGPGGAPLAEPGAGDAPAAPADDSSRSVQGVQIGATPVVKAEKPSAPNDALAQRVTVRVKGAPLATFLDTISAQAKVNFIITEGLETKRVTAFLQNVTVREALQVLLEIKGLTYQQIGKSNTYVVTPRSKSIENLITRIYTLSFVPLIALDSASQQQSAITPQSTTAGGTSSSGGGGPTGGGPTGGGQSGGQGGQGGSSGGSSGGSNIPIVQVLRSIMSTHGQIGIEPRTNSLIVTDIPEVFPQVEQIIAELDRKSPQIMIEAQIVEINSDRTKNIGIDWGGADGSLASFTGGQRDTSFPMQLPGDLTKTRFLDPILPGNIISSIGSATAGSAASASGGTTASSIVTQSFIKTSVLDLTQLQVALRALVSRSEARFLGKPKVLTVNNNPAVIQVSRNQAVSVTSSQSSVGGSVGSSGFTVERVPTGLVLRVTPQVNKDGYVTLLVQPSFTDTQQSSLSSGGNPIFDAVSRGTSTLVLGGLLSSTETKAVRKVPLLGYIPLIGWLFTSSNTERTNTDLVIFLTPTVVND